MLVLGGLLLWLVYTRGYFALHQAHATLPPCPFLLLTGHPCPLCGGTRAFAYTWRGDLSHAVRLYPLGPALFALTLVAVPALLLAIVLRHDVSVKLPRGTGRWLGAAIVIPLAVSWALKLTVLPN